MKKLNLLLLILGLGFLGSSISSCVAVKPYQKSYLNDPDMKLGVDHICNYELSCETYREAATGATGGKSGGGCGCY